jgi:tRNA-splicing ligase RtcB
MAEVKTWTDGVAFDANARQQVDNVASLPFVFRHVAVMPDVHWGIGATVGSVIPTRGAIIPAAVGVDIGCGMIATQTTLRAIDLPDSLASLRTTIERRVPVGNGPGGDHRDAPARVDSILRSTDLAARLDGIHAKHPKIRIDKMRAQLGTLGGGNHFIEVCLDETDHVWVMLHSGSRGTGNIVGRYFIERAREELLHRTLGYHVPDRDLAFFAEGEPLFDDYVEAVAWGAGLRTHQSRRDNGARARCDAQCAATVPTDERRGRLSPQLRRTRDAFRRTRVDHAQRRSARARRRTRHHPRVDGRAVLHRARQRQCGIVPLVLARGGTAHVARAREEGDHARRARGRDGRRRVPQRRGRLGRIPAAYKDIDAVMAAQTDLVDIVHTLKQVVCIKG